MNEEYTYKDAKKKCRLNDREVEMAREMGISPKTLIHNIPSKGETWKDPVALWIRRRYDSYSPKARPTP